MGCAPGGGRLLREALLLTGSAGCPPSRPLIWLGLRPPCPELRPLLMLSRSLPSLPPPPLVCESEDRGRHWVWCLWLLQSRLNWNCREASDAGESKQSISGHSTRHKLQNQCEQLQGLDSKHQLSDLFWKIKTPFRGFETKGNWGFHILDTEMMKINHKP